MTPNILVILASALVPFLFAMIWFHKNLFGGTNWNSIAEIPAEKANPVKPLKLALSLVLNVIIAFGVFQFSIHELAVYGMVGGDAELATTGVAGAMLAEYGGDFHTWTHGLAHGLGVAIFFVLPVLGYVCIFEKKSFNYFLVYFGYWAISLIIMSIIICLWGAEMTMG
jgi:hypothetical protein